MGPASPPDIRRRTAAPNATSSFFSPQDTIPLNTRAPSRPHLDLRPREQQNYRKAQDRYLLGLSFRPTHRPRICAGFRGWLSFTLRTRLSTHMVPHHLTQTFPHILSHSFDQEGHRLLLPPTTIFLRKDTRLFDQPFFDTFPLLLPLLAPAFLSLLLRGNKLPVHTLGIDMDIHESKDFIE
jgi:hypothetical protein